MARESRGWHGTGVRDGDYHVVEDSAGLKIAQLGKLAVVVRSGAHLPHTIPRMRTGVEEIAALHPQGIALIIVLKRNTATPGSQARVHAMEMFQSFTEHVRVLAIVFEGHGFAVAARRAVMATLVRFAITGTSIRVFAALRPALAWITEAGQHYDVVLRSAHELERSLGDWVDDETDVEAASP